MTSLQLRHVDIEQRLLLHDALCVQTKFRKTFDSWFYPIGDDFEEIDIDWVRFLSEERQWALDDPLFPATKLKVGNSGQFKPTGLTREHWKGTGAIRDFPGGIANAGLPYSNPHSVRNTVIAHGCSLNLIWDEMQAWAQNMGHESLTTTFGNYGRIASRDQGILVRNAGKRTPANAKP